MQNIKYCPKCNQTSTEAISFCPFDGTALVEMQPAQNQPPQTPSAVQPQAGYTATVTPQQKTSPVLKGCLALIGIPFVFMILVGAWWYSGNPRSQNVENNSSDNATPANTAVNLTNQPTNEEPNRSSEKIDKSSAAWKAGYKIGLRDGRDPDNPPQFSPVHLNVMIKGAVSQNKPKDPVNWEAGYREGFLKGYRNPYH